jgi:hypothetical protein
MRIKKKIKVYLILFKLEAPLLLSLIFKAVSWFGDPIPMEKWG